MRYQSVNVMYYADPFNKEVIQIAYLRTGQGMQEDDLPVRDGEYMRREEFLERFATWHIDTPDDGQSITFTRLVSDDRARVLWPHGKRLKYERRITRPADVHYLDQANGPHEAAVFKTDLRTIWNADPPSLTAHLGDIQHFYAHHRAVQIWRCERVEVDPDTMTVIEYGYKEVFIANVWTDSPETPEDDEE